MKIKPQKTSWFLRGTKPWPACYEDPYIGSRAICWIHRYYKPVKGMKQNGKNALLESGPPFYVVISATRRSSRLQCKGSEPWPAPGIEIATSHSEPKRSKDWANPARMISTADGNANQNEDKLSVLKNRAQIWGKIFSGKIVLNLVWHTDALFAEYSARRSHKLTTCLFCSRFPEFKISPTLGNSQLAASCQLGFFYHVMFYLDYSFLIIWVRCL